MLEKQTENEEGESKHRNGLTLVYQELHKLQLIFFQLHCSPSNKYIT